jgi:hypothetical protein
VATCKALFFLFAPLIFSLLSCLEILVADTINSFPG